MVQLLTKRKDTRGMLGSQVDRVSKNLIKISNVVEDIELNI